MLVLDYHQLVAISRNGSNCDQQSGGALLSVEEPGRDGGGGPDWGMADACVEAVGPNGDGFVAVKGMKNYASLRSRLLRLAQRLALMPDLERAAILKVQNLVQNLFYEDIEKMGPSPARWASLWVLRVWVFFPLSRQLEKRFPKIAIYFQV
jgi:hypothetical protein